MGGKETPVYDTDTHFDDYKQESFFQYLFGAREPGLMALIDYNNLIDKKVKEYLFIPRHPQS
jgi:Xaa-Pro dipeptidase